MKKEYIKENNIIERYLLNQLSDEERLSFRTALLFDKELRQEVEDNRLLYQHIQQLKPTESTRKTVKRFHWLIIAAFISIGIVGSYFLYDYFKNPIPSPPTTITTSEQDNLNQNTTLIETPSMENTSIKTTEIPPKEKTPTGFTTPPTTTHEEKQEKKEKEQQPMAEADLTPHPYLDQFTTSAFRNNAVKIEFFSPQQQETLFLKDGKITLNIKGKLLLSETPDNDRFSIHIFTNKQSDFDNFRPIISAKPLIKKENNNYLIQHQSIIPLSSGLYYFILEDNEIEDMIYIGKFFVKK